MPRYHIPRYDRGLRKCGILQKLQKYYEWGSGGLYYEVEYKSTETENEDIIHRFINLNETETKRDTLDRVIEEFPNDTSPDMMEDCVTEELYDNQNKYWNEENKTGLYEEEEDK